MISYIRNDLMVTICSPETTCRMVKKALCLQLATIASIIQDCKGLADWIAPVSFPGLKELVRPGAGTLAAMTAHILCHRLVSWRQLSRHHLGSTP